MKKRLLLPLALAALAASALFAFAQQLAPGSFTGLETAVFSIGGPGGSSEFATTGMLTNTTRGVTTGCTTGTCTWPGNAGITNQYSTLVYTGAVGTATQNLPATPFDGSVVELLNGSGSAMTALTVAVTDGSTTVNFGTALALAAGASAQFYYLKSTNSWYRMR